MSQIICSAARRSLTVWSHLRQNARLFATPSTPAETPKPTEAAKPAQGGSTSAHLSSKTHKVDDLERKMLVWSGKYKSADDIPTYVDQNVMEKARNIIRIRTANIMIAITIIACIYMVYSGKQAAERGESIQKENLDWHKEYNEKSQADAAQAAKAALKK